MYCHNCRAECPEGARFCSACGQAFDGPPVARPSQGSGTFRNVPERGRVTTTEATGKTWKGAMVLGGFAVVGGVIGLLMTSLMPTPSTGAVLLCIALIGIGGFIYMTAKIGAWWEHG